MLENAGQAGLDRMSIWLSGEGRSRNAGDALDVLTEAVFTNIEDQRTYTEQKAEGFLDGADKYLSDNIQRLSDVVAEKTGKILKSKSSLAVKAPAGLVNLAASFINEQRAEELAIGVTSWMNRRDGLHGFRALINDLIGPNSPVLDMISKVKHEVSRTRQQFREDLPPILESKFKRPLQAVQKTAMFKALGKTDLASLTSTFGVSGALDLITKPQTLTREIQKLEKKYGPQVISKSKQLANYMLTGEHGVMLLPNAYAISALANTGTKNLKADKKMVDDIDRLVSLYALQGLDQDTRTTVEELLRNDRAGVEFMTNYLVGQRVDEMAKIGNNQKARLNHYKGAIPSENQQGGSLRIAHENNHAKMVMQGYRRIGDYNGAPI